VVDSIAHWLNVLFLRPCIVGPLQAFGFEKYNQPAITAETILSTMNKGKPEPIAEETSPMLIQPT
jgi:hypothetical protein